MSDDSSCAPFLFISGPTASGKSGLAIALAKRFNGEIVNLDSVQLLKEFDIGSAKPSKEELDQAPHHLIDVLSPYDRPDAGWFMKEARKCIDQISSRGRLPIVCGGTNLYLVALIHGMIPNAGSDPSERARLEEFTNQELIERLHAVDPSSATRISPNDRVRLVRALELCKLNGSASAVRTKHNFSENTKNVLGVVLLPERSDAYRRINSRTEQMLNRGLVDEVRAIRAQYGENVPGLRALGYRQVCKFISGEISNERLLDEISMETRRYAKRQMTFWRNEPAKRGWNLVDRSNQEGLGREEILALLGEELPKLRELCASPSVKIYKIRPRE